MLEKKKMYPADVLQNVTQMVKKSYSFNDFKQRITQS